MRFLDSQALPRGLTLGLALLGQKQRQEVRKLSTRACSPARDTAQMLKAGPKLCRFCLRLSALGVRVGALSDRQRD